VILAQLSGFTRCLLIQRLFWLILAHQRSSVGAMTNQDKSSPFRAPKTKLGRKGTFAWALWDWAEQPYPTIMQTFIFPVYLASAVAEAGTNADALLGIAIGVAGFLLAVIAPVLGRRSDEGGKRKFWLMVNTYVLVAIMVASFFVEPKGEFLLFGLVLYGLGSVVQETAFNSIM
jgi:UMF1 family MFS transporter